MRVIATVSFARIDLLFPVDQSSNLRLATYLVHSMHILGSHLRLAHFPQKRMEARLERSLFHRFRPLLRTEVLGDPEICHQSVSLGTSPSQFYQLSLIVSYYPLTEYRHVARNLREMVHLSVSSTIGTYREITN